MSAINLVNLKKTYYYLKRNGLRSTWYAVRERLEERHAAPYAYVLPAEEELQRQRGASRRCRENGEYHACFSIVVPAYRTNRQYLKEMIDSVRSQTYPYWELIIADATEDESVADAVTEYDGADKITHDIENGDMISGEFRAGRILCVRLPENKGISDNSNAALHYVKGDYAGLLDHDDLLTADALYEMAEQIRAGRQEGNEVQILYSDEDKCSSDCSRYYEPNCKENFNLDLVLSNNYICHFMVMKTGLIKELGFRREYEGAQDYDLVLRAVTSLQLLHRPQEERKVVHVPKVLYHWRCHAASTAENPHSKDYAYEAGRRALKDFADCNGLEGDAVPLRHVGFYRLVYRRGLFESRSDLGIAGGRIVVRGRIAGGRMDGEGNLYYSGLPAGYSGYLHRAVLTQDAEAVDVRCMAVRKELRGLFEQIAGVPYQCLPETEYFDISALQPGTDYRELSLKLCRAVREKGYRILWMPSVSNATPGKERK